MRHVSPQAQAVLDQLDQLGGTPIETLEPSEARRQPTPTDAVQRLREQRDGDDAKPEAVGSTEMRDIDGVKTRIYRPLGAGHGTFDKLKDKVGMDVDGDNLLPVLVYVHGGGWVIADLDVYDSAPRALANRANCIVVSVDYRRAPEHQFPAAHDDVLAVTRWLQQHAEEIGGDVSRIAIGGESAGGNMATATCLTIAKDGGTQPVFQLLVYPVTDLVHDDWDSYVDSRDAKPLNLAMLQWFGTHTMRTPADASDYRLSPLHADEALIAQTPPALVIMAESDPLRGQGQAYAKKLAELGVPTETTTYEGTMHEFFGMGAVIDQAAEAVDQAGAALRTVLATSPATAGSAR